MVGPKQRKNSLNNNRDVAESIPEPPPRRQRVRPETTDNRVDKIFTIGCFDLLHYGHVKLFRRMRALGKQVIVGVHDDNSIRILKNRIPIDNTEQRMLNVNRYADVVYCVAGTDPWTFLKCIFSKSKGETYLYVRGDDMPDFPARSECEKLMPVRLISYTQGVSSTELRKVIGNKMACNPKWRRDEDDYSLFY